MKKIITLILLMSFSHEAMARPYMAVLSYVEDSSSQKQTELFTDRLRAEFYRRYGGAVLNREETSDLFSYHKKSVLEKRRGQGEHFLEEAKKAYFEFRFEDAQDLLKKLFKNPAEDLWVDANILLGLTAFAQGNISQAESAFREVGRLDPGRELDPKFFSPKVVRLFKKQTQKTHWATATLQVNADPEGAEVYVNGVKRGLAPLTLKDFPVGAHKIRVQASHYQSEMREVHLEMGELKQFSAKLVWEKSQPKVKDHVLGLTASEMGVGKNGLKDEKLIPLASEIGGEMGASKVLLVTYQKEKGQERVVTQLIDMTLSTAHKKQVHEVSHIEERSGEFASEIADHLLEQIGRDIKMDPNKYGENRYQGDIVLIGRRAKPFYRRPIFWVFVGAVAAGGGLAAALAGSEATTGAVGIAFQ